MSRHNKHHNERLPPFVPLLKDTLQSRAWRAMSLGARALYIAIKARNVKNNGRIYLSHRKAAQDIGSHTRYIGRWFRELQHYGFIVMTNPGGLGVDGKGKAPHWRLTELGCIGSLPTRDSNDGTAQRSKTARKNKSLSHKRETPCPTKGRHHRLTKGRHLTEQLSHKRGTYTRPSLSHKRGT